MARRGPPLRSVGVEPKAVQHRDRWPTKSTQVGVEPGGKAQTSWSSFWGWLWWHGGLVCRPKLYNCPRTPREFSSIRDQRPRQQFDLVPIKIKGQDARQEGQILVE